MLKFINMLKGTHLFDILVKYYDPFAKNTTQMFEFLWKLMNYFEDVWRWCIFMIGNNVVAGNRIPNALRAR